LKYPVSASPALTTILRVIKYTREEMRLYKWRISAAYDLQPTLHNNGEKPNSIFDRELCALNVHLQGTKFYNLSLSPCIYVASFLEIHGLSHHKWPSDT
jgi:hypothetical protein